MPGYKGSWTGTSSSSDIVDYLMKQSIMVFSTTAARDTALSGALREGMYAYISGTDSLYRYTGSAWKILESPWTSITPTFNNLSTGNGTAVGEWRYVNGDLRYRGQFTYGTTSSITAGVEVDIPDSVTARAIPSSGAVLATDASTGVDYTGVARCLGGVDVFAVHAADDNIDVGIPFTWASGDVFTWDITIPV